MILPRLARTGRGTQISRRPKNVNERRRDAARPSFGASHNDQIICFANRAELDSAHRFTAGSASGALMNYEKLYTKKRHDCQAIFAK